MGKLSRERRARNALTAAALALALGSSTTPWFACQPFSGSDTTANPSDGGAVDAASTEDGGANPAADSATPAGDAGEVILLGQKKVPGFRDQVDVGQAEAFIYPAAAPGIITALHLHTYTPDGGALSGSVILGLYSDVNGAPGVRLATSKAIAPKPDDWTAFPVDATKITAGNYWIAALPVSNPVYYESTAVGAGPSTVEMGVSPGALPTTWGNNTAPGHNSPCAMYATGTAP